MKCGTGNGDSLSDLLRLFARPECSQEVWLWVSPTTFPTHPPYFPRAGLGPLNAGPRPSPHDSPRTAAFAPLNAGAKPALPRSPPHGSKAIIVPSLSQAIMMIIESLNLPPRHGHPKVSTLPQLSIPRTAMRRVRTLCALKPFGVSPRPLLRPPPRAHPLPCPPTTPPPHKPPFMLCECPLMSLVGLTAPPSPPVCFLGLTRRVPRFYISSPVSAVVIRSAHRSNPQPPPLGPLFMSAVADMAGVHRYPSSRLPFLCDGAVCPLALPRVFFMVFIALFARL